MLTVILIRVFLTASGFALAVSPASRFRTVSIIMEFLTFGG